MQRIILFISLTLLLAGCVTAPEPLTKKNSELTQGMVQMKLEVGSTSKTEVLETFGAPNITTRDGKGDEVWTYQRQAQARFEDAEGETSKRSGCHVRHSSRQ